jgi:hypothetical protein
MSNQQILYYAVPAVVGTAVAVATLLVGVQTVIARSKSRPHKPPPPRPPADEDDESFANRRGSVRREGSPVQVVMTSASLRGGQGSGYVLDRSTGGLRVAVKSEIPAGTALHVRAANAPESVPWVTVQVRSCRNAGPHYELGCEFVQTPPWNVLLLFG